MQDKKTSEHREGKKYLSTYNSTARKKPSKNEGKIKFDSDIKMPKKNDKWQTFTIRNSEGTPLGNGKITPDANTDLCKEIKVMGRVTTCVIF